MKLCVPEHTKARVKSYCCSKLCLVYFKAATIQSEVNCCDAGKPWCSCQPPKIVVTRLSGRKGAQERVDRPEYSIKKGKDFWARSGRGDLHSQIFRQATTARRRVTMKRVRWSISINIIGRAEVMFIETLPRLYVSIVSINMASALPTIFLPIRISYPSIVHEIIFIVTCWRAVVIGLLISEYKYPLPDVAKISLCFWLLITGDANLHRFFRMEELYDKPCWCLWVLPNACICLQIQPKAFNTGDVTWQKTVS